MPICTGKAVFISFCTPEREVNVLLPVKFIARKDDRPPIIRNKEAVSIHPVPVM